MLWFQSFLVDDKQEAEHYEVETLYSSINQKKFYSNRTAIIY